MSSESYWGRMIGKHHYLKVFTRAKKILVNGREDLLVYKLYRKHLIVGLSAMSALVRTFNVNVNVIGAVLKCLYSSGCLAVVISMYVTRSTLNVNRGHTCADSYSFDKIDSRNYRRVKSPLFLEGRKLRLLSGAPEPDRVSGAQTALLARFIYGMILKYLVAILHYLEEFRAAVILSGEIFTYTLTDNIVRTCEIIFVHISLPHKTMAIAKTCIKMLDVITKRCVDSLYELICLSGRYLICGIIGNDPVLVIFLFFGKCNKVASDSRILVLHCKSHAESFKRGTSLGVHLGIKGKDRHISGITFGNHSVGHV